MVSEWEAIEKKVNKFFNLAIKTKETIIMTEQTNTTTYTSIEDYSNKTGKRYRMLKEQKARSLTREQAFAETYLNGSPVVSMEPSPSEEDAINSIDEALGDSLE